MSAAKTQVSATSYHRPVLLEETLEWLDVKPDGRYLDATLGGGGYAEGILSRLGPRGLLVGIDRDPEAVEYATNRLRRFSQLQIIRANFSEFFSEHPRYSRDFFDGIVADLGLSSHQVDTRERGFSFMREGPLDMRMDPEDATTAYEVVNFQEPAVLESIFREFGELRNARRLVERILRARAEAPIETTVQLAHIVGTLFPENKRNSGLARVFQALRIEVNKEVLNLSKFLVQAHEALRSGGRLVTIAYHSLEDRKIKEFMKFAEAECVCPPGLPVCTCGKKRTMKRPIRKVVRPGEEEIESNPRARSARLRVAVKL
jgi:16S rRNA (cytosine1402-N4)-methyltransferase